MDRKKSILKCHEEVGKLSELLDYDLGEFTDSQIEQLEKVLSSVSQKIKQICETGN